MSKILEKVEPGLQELCVAVQATRQDLGILSSRSNVLFLESMGLVNTGPEGLGTWLAWHCCESAMGVLEKEATIHYYICLL